MSFCNKCGAQITPNATFCPSCGTQSTDAQQQGPQQQGYSGGNDATNNKAMGILAYLGILVLIPFFTAKESPFARFHANQGLVLAIAEIAYGIVISILGVVFLAMSWRLAAIMSTIFGIVWLAFLGLAILGIINAANGKTAPLPVIGKITILK